MTTPLWDKTVSSLSEAFPSFRVRRYSESWFWRLFKKTLLVWSAATTVGYTVYIGDSYFGNDRGAEILRHEGEHVADWDEWGLLMIASYFFLLPTVLTMRAVWEWHGYREDLRSVHETYCNYDPVFRDNLYDHYSQWIANQFCGSHYFFMFPFRKTMYEKCRRFIRSLEPGNPIS